jgi:hypothetical protein
MVKATSLLLIVLASAAFSASGLPQRNRLPQTPAKVTQIIENRGGRVACWGVVIQLGKLRFRVAIRSDQIAIREAKHGHDLRRMMSWRVGENGKRLVIKFKPGMGDFGSGNSVEIQIDRSVLAGQIESPNNRFEWSINTDVL